LDQVERWFAVFAAVGFIGLAASLMWILASQ
jgi:hypothetical protein